MLKKEIPDLERYLSTICNDWDLIYKKLNGNISVKRVLDLFKSQTVFLKPDEYKLEPVLIDIGSTKPQIIQKAKDWYSIMKERQYSTIPKIQGKIDDYEYEILDLDNPLALSVGYLTRCCFLLDGLSKESLYHSISSKNGRTFVVRKNGELIAQSWTWRNGNVEIQILPKDSRANEECKSKSEEILEQIKTDKIEIPEDVGGDYR